MDNINLVSQNIYSYMQIIQSLKFSSNYFSISKKIIIQTRMLLNFLNYKKYELRFLFKNRRINPKQSMNRKPLRLISNDLPYICATDFPGNVRIHVVCEQTVCAVLKHSRG